METQEKTEEESPLRNVLRLWERDSVIDMTEPSKEILRVPLLHSKYLNILTKHRLASKKASFDIARMKKIKWEYYTGKMDKEELEKHGWEPFRFTLKSDVATYLEADTDIIELMKRKSYHDEVVEVCTAIMKELSNRTFQLREHMTFERFIGGR